MAAYELAAFAVAEVEETPAEAPTTGARDNADALFQLGMSYATGRSVPLDLVSAHKWFNLAAMRGNKDAIRLRQEIAEQMTNAEIAEAQRAARNWLTTH